DVCVRCPLSAIARCRCDPGNRASGQPRVGLGLQRHNAGGLVVKTIVGSFDSYPTARRVARALMDEGYMSRDIGIMASNAAGDYRGDTDDDKQGHTATCALTGGVVGGAAGLAASLMALTIPGLG